MRWLLAVTHLGGQEEAWPVPAWLGHLLSAKATAARRGCHTAGRGPLEAEGRGSPEDSKGKREALEEAVAATLIAPASGTASFFQGGGVK